MAYPWLHTSFELWLLVCNVAYLFDQTPFYRPWLSWIGVDLRRLGSEDFVRYTRAFCIVIADITMATACCGLGSSENIDTRQAAWHNRLYPTFDHNVAPFTFRLPEAFITHSYLLHKIPRVVVLPRFARPIFISLTPWPRSSSPSYASSSPTRPRI